MPLSVRETQHPVFVQFFLTSKFSIRTARLAFFVEFFCLFFKVLI